MVDQAVAAEAAAGPALAGAPVGYWPRRWILVSGCFLSILVCYIDRVNISYAILPMAKEYGWDTATQGWVLSSFFVGYLVTQLLGGWWAAHIGGRALLAFGVLWWSLFTILTPPAASISLGALIAARIGMGLGEGVAFPAIYQLFGRWIPLQERARAAALNGSGIPLGTVAATLLTPWLVVGFGWPVVFYVSGAVGVVWYAFWFFTSSERLEDAPGIHASEIAYIRAHTAPAIAKLVVPWGKIFRSAAVWVLVFNHFCSNWGFYVILSWLPRYFADVHGLDLKGAGYASLLPWLVMFAMTNVGAQLADGLLRRGRTVTFVRKLMQSIGFFGAAAALLGIAQVHTVPLAIGLMCVALGLGSFALSGFASNHLDIGPRYAGALMGLSNTAGTLPGVIGVAVTGYILEATGSWPVVLGIAASLYVAGAIAWLIFATGEKIFD
jgi:MFS transporter, ACS family, solute carrier family 17 (sodium-dependent inorganic phosphate cotransporter), other